MKWRSKYAEKRPSREELAQRPLVARGLGEQPLGAAVEPGDLGEHPEVGRPPQVGGGGEQAARARARRPTRDRSRRRCTESDISDSWVATPSSAKSRSSVGYVRRLWTMNPVSMRQLAGLGGDPVGVGVAAEPVVGLEERHVRRPGGDVRGHEPGDTGPDHGQPSGAVGSGHQAFSKVKIIIGSVVGSSEPSGAGSRVMPAPRARPGSPSKRTSPSSPVITPAGTMPSPWSSHSS